MPWGFVFYRNTKCTNPEWAEYRRRFYKLIALQFSPYNDLPGVAEAKALFLISWEEDESLAEKTHQEIARSAYSPIRECTRISNPSIQMIYQVDMNSVRMYSI